MPEVTFDTYLEGVRPSLSNAGRFAVACGKAAEAIRESIQPKADEPVAYVVRRFNLSREDGWATRIIGTIRRAPVGQPERAGRFSKVKGDPEAVLKSFCERGDAYKKLRDEDVWAVAVDYLNQAVAVDADTARTLENALNFALLARAGLLDVEGWRVYSLAAENPPKGGE